MTGQALHPAQQVASVLPPGTGFTIWTPSWEPWKSVLGVLLESCWGWSLVDPAQKLCQPSALSCKLWCHLVAYGCGAPSWVLCALKCRCTSAGGWWGTGKGYLLALCSLPLSKTVCCSGSRFRGIWNHVFVNRVWRHQGYGATWS